MEESVLPASLRERPEPMSDASVQLVDTVITKFSNFFMPDALFNAIERTVESSYDLAVKVLRS